MSTVARLEKRTKNARGILGKSTRYVKVSIPGYSRSLSSEVTRISEAPAARRRSINLPEGVFFDGGMDSHPALDGEGHDRRGCSDRESQP